FNNDGAAWSEQIDAVGPVKAYSEFKSAYAKKDFMTQHIAAQVFGELLYEKKGVEGLSACDETFSFGCDKRIFLDAWRERGLEAESALEAMCLERTGF